MSIKVFPIISGEFINAEPTGQLKLNGWLPGTWVKVVNVAPVMNKNVIAVVDVCGYNDFPAGFIYGGSSRLKSSFDFSFPNSNESSGKWTVDQNIFFTAYAPEPNTVFENNQLTYSGTGIVCVNLQNTGVHKFYVFEKYNLLYRTSNGVDGALLNWNANIGRDDALYVSSRGLITCENESGTQHPLASIMLSKLSDENGEFIAIASN